MFNINDIHKKTLVACSGGIDSLSLLLYLIENHFQVTAIHINHEAQIASDKMSQELSAICNQFNIPFVEIKIGKQLKSFSESNMRKIRYQELIYFAQKNNFKQICLGHTYDDQIENFLIRLFRGAGINGLKKMSRIKNINNIEIIRPLIDTSKDQLKLYLQNKKVNYIQDITNEESKYLRNQIRLIILPFLHQYCNNIYSNIYTTQTNLSEAQSFIQRYMNKFLQNNLSIIENKLYIVKDLYMEDEFMQKEIINNIIYQITQIKKYYFNIANNFYGELSGVYLVFDNNLYAIRSNTDISIELKQFIKTIKFSNQKTTNRFKKFIQKSSIIY